MFALVASPPAPRAPARAIGTRDGVLGRRTTLYCYMRHVEETKEILRTDATDKLDLDTVVRELLAVAYAHIDLHSSSDLNRVARAAYAPALRASLRRNTLDTL